MENEYMKVAYDIIHIYALVLIIASSMHSTVGSGNAESTTTVRYAYSSTHTASSASQWIKCKFYSTSVCIKARIYKARTEINKKT